MPELQLSCGFLPRVDRRNHRGVERALALATSQTLFGGHLDVPWLLAEGPWASDEPPLLEHRRELGFQVLVDTQAWRYRHAETFRVEKFLSAPWAPTDVVDVDDHDGIRRFAVANMVGQQDLQADAVIIPGFVPRRADDDIIKPTLVAIDAAHTKADREMVAFVGVHRSNLEAGRRLLDELPAYISAVYIQFTPVNPRNDSTELLVAMARLLLEARARDFKVIAGRLGAMATTAVALGIDAADAGLAEGEAFEVGSKLRVPPPRGEDSARQPLPGGRVYVPKLGRSFSASEFRRLANVPNVRQFLACELPCCRYSQLRDAPGRAHAHALWARRTESAELLKLPASMRIDAEVRRLEGIRSNVVAANHSLVSADLAPIGGAHVERHLDLLHRVAEAGAAAA